MGTIVFATREPSQETAKDVFGRLPSAYPTGLERSLIPTKYMILLAHPTRFERVTFAFGGQRSTTELLLALYAANDMISGWARSARSAVSSTFALPSHRTNEGSRFTSRPLTANSDILCCC